MRTRTDNFGIIAIVVSIVSGVWIFGFADDVFSSFQKGFDDVSHEAFYVNSNEPKESGVIEDDIQVSSVTEPHEPVSNKPIPNSKAKPENSESVTPVIEKPTTEKHEKKIKQVSLDEKIEQLEEQTFVLFGDGSGYEGASHLSERAELDLELKSVSGTQLEEFDIKSGTLEIGGHTFTIEGGSVTLTQDVISLSIAHVDHRDPYLDMTGTVNGSILNDKSLSITFENQLLGLMEADPTPIHLSLELTMEVKK